MAEETQEIALNLGTDVSGDQVLCLGGLRKVLKEAEVESLITRLTSGKELVKQKKAALKVIENIDKQFNGGIPIESKLRTAAESGSGSRSTGEGGNDGQERTDI